MKKKGGVNTPKTLSELRKEKRKLLTQLDQTRDSTRVTRLRSVHGTFANKRTIKDLEEKIREINFELEQRGVKMTERTPPKKTVDNPKNITFTTTFAEDGKMQTTAIDPDTAPTVD